MKQTLRAWLGPAIGLGHSDPRVDYGGLYDDELTGTARMRPARRLEFTAGRHAARLALADMGQPPAPIPMGADRAPIWPDGIVGSIAHCHTACIAAVAPAGQRAGIGIDIEPAAPLPLEIWSTVLTPAERNWLAAQPVARRGLLAQRIFVAKEATYKARYIDSGQMLTFQGVTIVLAPERFSAHFHTKTLHGRHGSVGGYIIAGLSVPAR